MSQHPYLRRYPRWDRDEDADTDRRPRTHRRDRERGVRRARDYDDDGDDWEARYEREPGRRGRRRAYREPGESREPGEEHRARGYESDDYDREVDDEYGFDDDAAPAQHYRGFRTRSVQRAPGGRGLRVSESYFLVGPFTGRGPKGYRRSDDKIVEDVSERLERHGQIDASEVEVSCEDGIVTLRGKVSDRQTKRLAEDCAEDVYGVSDVMNELRIDKGFFSRLFGRGDDDEDAEERSSKRRNKSR